MTPQLTDFDVKLPIDMTGMPGQQTRTMRPGLITAAGVRSPRKENNRGTLCKFLGVSTDGKTITYPTTKAAHDAGHELETLYAHFHDEVNDFGFVAFRYNYRWCVGSQAAPLKLKRVPQQALPTFDTAQPVLAAPAPPVRVRQRTRH